MFNYAKRVYSTNTIITAMYVKMFAYYFSLYFVLQFTVFLEHTQFQDTGTADAQDGETASPAASILQSTERVANVIVNTLSVKRSITISRPNLGMYKIYCRVYTSLQRITVSQCSQAGVTCQSG